MRVDAKHRGMDDGDVKHTNAFDVVDQVCGTCVGVRRAFVVHLHLTNRGLSWSCWDWRGAVDTQGFAESRAWNIIELAKPASIKGEALQVADGSVYLGNEAGALVLGV